MRIFLDRRSFVTERLETFESASSGTPYARLVDRLSVGVCRSTKGKRIICIYICNYQTRAVLRTKRGFIHEKVGNDR